MSEEIRADLRRKLWKNYWYYTVELEPGRYTPGQEHPNFLTTRDFLSRIDPDGREVVDIGTMEGVVPTLLARRGAKVSAMDAIDFSHKVDAVKDAYGVRFDYHARVPLDQTVSFLRRKHKMNAFMGAGRPDRGFDIVVCSGVLYHTFTFFEVLAMCRTLTRKGGLLVLETAASLRDELTLIWNFTGKEWTYAGGSNTWFVTARLLDHMLRLLRYRIVDVARVGGEAPGLTRLAVVAEAVDDLLTSGAEAEWFAKTADNMDYNHFYDDEFAVGTAKPFDYRPRVSLPTHEGFASVNVHRAAVEMPSMPLDQRRVRLSLNDRV